MKPEKYYDFPERDYFRLPEYDQEIIEVKSPVLEPKQEGSYKLEGFEIEDELKKVKGAFIEVAGPSSRDYHFVDINKLPKDIFVSNIFPGSPKFNGQTGEFDGYYGKVDFQADAKNMPLKSRSIGALFVKHIGPIADHSLPYEEKQKRIYNLRLKMLEEAGRILEDGGFLIIDGVDIDIFDNALKLGFSLKQYTLYKGSYYGDFIFKKEISRNETDV